VYVITTTIILRANSSLCTQDKFMGNHCDDCSP